MKVEFTFRGLYPPPRNTEMFNVQCGMCAGHGVMFHPRLGVSSDGNNGTVQAPMDCLRCDGSGWISPSVERDLVDKD